MINLYKFHTDPNALMQAGLQAKLQEVFNFVSPLFEHFVYQFNEDPDGTGEKVEIEIERESTDTEVIQLFFRRGHYNERYKRITLILMQVSDNVVLHGRSTHIESNNTYNQDIKAYDHGVFDENAVDDFIEELLHHF